MNEPLSTGRPIGDYGFLSDCHSSALVSGEGGVDWMCLPRFDSPSVFGRLLDAEAGHWSIRPEGENDTRRRYVDDTLVLETQYEAPSGTAMMTDALALGPHCRGHNIGQSAPHALIRVVEVTAGTMTFVAEFAPRPEYGLVHPRLRAENGCIVTLGGAGQWCLSGPAPTDIEEGRATWLLELTKGDAVAFALQYTGSDQAAPEPLRPRAIQRLLKQTITAWQSWSSLHQGFEGPWQDLVRHSGRVLQGLTYQPTGAIIAAPTTSLPEVRGGDRNWDYRYSWIRDVSLTMNALWVSACPDEAGRFLSWIVETAGSTMARDLQIVYGIGGEHDLPERELPHLTGWRGSSPVRIGNGASTQTQLDIYGELLDAVFQLREGFDDPDEVTSGFLEGVADAAADRWTEPGQGIWELRGEPQHYVHSKLMCWVALDRAIRLAPWMHRDERISTWAAARDDIRDAILNHGWNDKEGAFTQAFGSTVLDAAVLMIPISGFLPADDPRVLSTIDRIEHDLAAPCGLLYRFRDVSTEGDPAAAEGTFVLCSYWLVQAHAMAGRIGRARTLFERITAYTNDVGLLSEEVDPFAGELLGNFPQGLSHIGLINAAWAIEQAEAHLAGSTDGSGSSSR